VRRHWRRHPAATATTSSVREPRRPCRTRGRARKPPAAAAPFERSDGVRCCRRSVDSDLAAAALAVGQLRHRVAAGYRPRRRLRRVARQEARGEESGIAHDAQAAEEVLGVPVGGVGDLVEGPGLVGGCHRRCPLVHRCDPGGGRQDDGRACVAAFL